MPFYQSQDIRYYGFQSLLNVGVTQAIFTRQGGVSAAPWASLNLGSTVGDDLDCVMENRRRAFGAVGRDLDSLYDVWQVHGTRVVYVDHPRPANMEHLQADILLTDRPEVTLLMRFADCVPVLLVDPVRRVVGLVHAGWKGTVQRAAATAVQAMQTRYGCHAPDILAGIGPSIGPHHYEVGVEVVGQVRQAFGKAADGLLFQDGYREDHPALPADFLLEKSHAAKEKSRVKFDLWSANRLALLDAGVRQVEVAGLCTACHLQDWFSHRGESGKTGRFGAVLALNLS